MDSTEPKKYIKLTATVCERETSLIVADTPHNRVQLERFKASPFYKSMTPCDAVTEEDDVYLDPLYVPTYHKYMGKNIYLWYAQDGEWDKDSCLGDIMFLENSTWPSEGHEGGVALRVQLSSLGGADAFVVIYVPATSENTYELDYFVNKLNELEGGSGWGSGYEYDDVSLTFAKLHPKYYEDTGSHDDEQCLYLNKIQVPRLTSGQTTVEKWIGGYPKCFDWQSWLTRDL